MTGKIRPGLSERPSDTYFQSDQPTVGLDIECLDRGWIELKADPAGVSSSIVAAPSDVRQEMASVHPLDSERLLSAQIASKPKATPLGTHSP